MRAKRQCSLESKFIFRNLRSQENPFGTGIIILVYILRAPILVPFSPANIILIEKC